MIELYNQTAINYIVPLIILIGSSITLFGLAAAIPHQQDVSFVTFDALSDGIENYYDFRSPWKPRILSTALAAYTIRIGERILESGSVPMVKNIYQFTLGVWTSGWFFLTCLSLILALRKRSIFYIFGTFAGICFGYLVFYKTVIRLYSWDLPALFIFSIFVLLYINKKYWWVFVLIPLSIGLKETAFILCFAFIFSDQPWRTRILMTAGCFLISMMVKIGIDAYVHAPLFFTMRMDSLDGTSTELYLFSNVRLLLKDLIPLFANAGMLIALFLIPSANAEARTLKLIAIPFIAGIVLFGIVTEYRIWFELIPFSLYAIDSAVFGDPLKQQDSSIPAS